MILHILLFCMVLYERCGILLDYYQAKKAASPGWKETTSAAKTFTFAAAQGA